MRKMIPKLAHGRLVQKGEHPTRIAEVPSSILTGDAIFTVRNKVAKVMFLHLSVILFTGGGMPQCMLGCHPLEQAPP